MTTQTRIVVVVNLCRNLDVLQRHPQEEASVAASKIRLKPDVDPDEVTLVGSTSGDGDTPTAKPIFEESPFYVL